MDNRERCQVERKLWNTMLENLQYSYRQAKHKVASVVHTAKFKYCTERIAQAFSSEDLHQIVNTLSNILPPNILPTIYPSVNLPIIFIKHYINHVEKLRAIIASEHIASTLLLGRQLQLFLHLKSVTIKSEGMHY